MLMYGNHLNIIDSGVVYNLNSLKEGYPTLNRLFPPREIIRFENRDFDIAYMNYIFNYADAFMQFFQIIFDLYLGKDVYLIIMEEEWAENLAESLFKLIQQRYGYNAVRINCFEDYLYVVNSSSIPEFNTDYGISNFNMDRDRYTYIIEYAKMKGGSNKVEGD